MLLPKFQMLITIQGMKVDILFTVFIFSYFLYMWHISIISAQPFMAILEALLGWIISSKFFTTIRNVFVSVGWLLQCRWICCIFDILPELCHNYMGANVQLWMLKYSLLQQLLLFLRSHIFLLEMKRNVSLLHNYWSVHSVLLFKHTT